MHEIIDIINCVLISWYNYYNVKNILLLNGRNIIITNNVPRDFLRNKLAKTDNVITKQVDEYQSLAC